MRSGFLHLAEALAFREDMEVVSSTVRALVATLRAGEKCGVEPELIGKGTWACEHPLAPAAPPEAPPSAVSQPCGSQRALRRGPSCTHCWRPGLAPRPLFGTGSGPVSEVGWSEGHQPQRSDTHTDRLCLPQSCGASSRSGRLTWRSC